MYATLHNVRLDSVSTAVPSQEIRIEDELEYYGGSLKKAERARNMIGTNRRRIAYPDITASDLCMAAAERLLQDRNVDRKSIDAIIFVTQTPDYDLPATACILQHELGLAHSCAAFDVNQGCAGYVYGLWLAANLVSAQSCRRVLLLAGDASHFPRDPSNRIISPIFGDGGSASLLEWDTNVQPMRFAVGTYGEGFDAIIVPGGRSKVPYKRNFSENHAFFEDQCTEQGVPWRLNEVYMNGEEVFQFTLRVVPDHLKQFMQYCQTAPEAIDWLILHQANKQIVQNLAIKAGFPIEKAPWETFGLYGNLSSASIPAALCTQWGARPSMQSQHLLLCGYGVGLSCASCLLQTDIPFCTPVIDVSETRDHMTNDARMLYWTQRLSGKERS